MVYLAPLIVLSIVMGSVSAALMSSRGRPFLGFTYGWVFFALGAFAGLASAASYSAGLDAPYWYGILAWVLGVAILFIAVRRPSVENTATTTSAQQPETGFSGQLQALENVFHRGVLSREEYAARRQDLLSARLAGVDSLHASGLISDAEREEQRRRVLSEL